MTALKAAACVTRISSAADGEFLAPDRLDPATPAARRLASNYSSTMICAQRRHSGLMHMGLVRKQHGDGGLGEDVACRATEDHLAQPRMRIRAFDQQVGAKLGA